MRVAVGVGDREIHSAATWTAWAFWVSWRFAELPVGSTRRTRERACGRAFRSLDLLGSSQISEAAAASAAGIDAVAESSGVARTKATLRAAVRTGAPEDFASVRTSPAE